MDKLHCFFIQLSTNNYMDHDTIPSVTDHHRHNYLTTEKHVWDEITQFAADNGCNSILIDLADGVKYKSHPEIACEGAWEPEYLKEELKRLRKLGLTPYPKLNFSTGHGAWLGIYARMVATPKYYEVCKDLIDEVCEIFDYPEFFHLGLDEEDAINQQKKQFVCYRQHSLIWHDLKFFFDCVKAHNIRPAIWYDYYHTHTKEFLENVPKDVIICPWFYSYIYGDVSAPFYTNEATLKKLNSFKELSDHGYDVLSTGSNFANTYNFRHLIRWAKEHVAPEHNLGLVVTAWHSTNEKNKYRHLDAINLAKFALKEVEEIERGERLS